ncbi:TRAP transporter small permease [Planomicrobium sp. YIM 101495]|uniref:TRAP transporter small permease n=1 Tax=Planomicrobium sp. YIM 101495 TaxID=2665160 RepID=UPI0012B98CA1|nr:TRAP transporter small permease [Planomicrobium sp. YIM 101495]MTD30591.1 TRAP transporter small permease subunit [Planomicrobium sp. YIM 101495]
MKTTVVFVERFEKIFIYLSGIFLGLLSAIVFYEVIARYVFGSPTIWVSEISTYLLQFIVFFSMGYLLIKDEHLKVTFVLDKLKGRAKKAVRILNNILILPYAVILMIYGFAITSSTWEREATSPTLLAVPLWIPNSFIFLGGALLIIGALCGILKIIIEEPVELEEVGGELYD